MKTLWSIVFVLLCSSFSLSLTPVTEVFTVSTNEELEILSDSVNQQNNKLNLDSCQYWEFLQALGKRESLNNYQENRNPYYKGKYQFGRNTRQIVGFGHLSNKEFLSLPEAQEQAMYNLLRLNEEIMRELIVAYEGKIIRGVYITKSGILAGAHLAGPNGVYQFLTGGRDNRDWNNTRCSDYMREFGGYQFDLSKIDVRNASIYTQDSSR